MKTSNTKAHRQFASDNWSGICPEVMQAIRDANTGHVAAYGEDEYTLRASDAIRDFFEVDCDVFFTFNGTASNSLALASLCQSYHSVICHALAHLETDECGAPEFFGGGTKILLAAGHDGKIVPEEIEHHVTRRSDIHYPKPKAVSITQPTEMGTVYTVAELKAIWAVARKHGLRVHMDGSRLAHAVASLDAAPRELTWEAGVDVLCLGGTKAGMPVGEAVVFFNKDLSREFDFRCKQAGQLASKMRFLAAPWLGLLETGAYLGYARHANACAAKLAEKLNALDGVTLKSPCQANAVFVEFPPGAGQRLEEQGWHFYSFIGDGGARLMCSWDTTERDIDAFVDAVKSSL